MHRDAEHDGNDRDEKCHKKVEQHDAPLDDGPADVRRSSDVADVGVHEHLPVRSPAKLGRDS
jgi:hypothetical protein